jgi:polyisoprenyl-phosphate glycosyltransferase
MVTRSRPAIPKLAIVTPVFNEVDSFPFYVEAVTRILLDRDDVAVSVLFVDDGSSDRSWELISDLCDSDSRFRGIRLSRNVGAHTATLAGLSNLGPDIDAVVIMGCDLQDPPDTTLALLEKWRSGADIAWAERRTRDDPLWRRVMSRWFHALLRRSMPRGSLVTAGGFFLIDRRVVAAVRDMKEQNRVNFALVAWTGFDQVRVLYDRPKRIAGTPGWTLGKMLKTTYDAFVGFSTLPLKVMRLAAVIAGLLAGALSVFLVIDAVTGNRVPGWTSTVLVPSVFFAIQFGLIAIIGEYLYRIYAEVVNRPSFFVSAETTPVVSVTERLDDTGVVPIERSG